MSTKPIEKYISPLIESQFPSFYRDEGSRFITFLKAYYEWMETQEAYSVEVDFPTIDFIIGSKIFKLDNSSIFGTVTSYASKPLPIVKVLGDISTFTKNDRFYQVISENSYTGDLDLKVRLSSRDRYKVELIPSSNKSFTDIFSIGDYVRVANQTRLITSVTSNTLTVKTRFTIQQKDYESNLIKYVLSSPVKVRNNYKSPLPLAKARNLFNILSIDDTMENFIDHFRTKYFYDLPKDILADKRLVAKHIQDLYKTKGTKRAYELLFRILYNEDIEVYVPGSDLLRASDGQYTIPKYLEITKVDGIEQLIGETVTTSSRSGSAIIENVSTKVISGKVITILELSNIQGGFIYGDYILHPEFFPTTETAPRIIGSLNAIGIKNGGANFNVGDILRINGQGTEGLARVAAIKNENGKVLFTLENGGSGYSLNAIVTVAGGGGSGATFKVGGIIDKEFILINTDIIDDYDMLTLQDGTAGTRLFYNSNSGFFSNQSYATRTFNANTGVDSTDDFIFFATNPFVNNDLVVYTTDTGNTVISGLTNTGSYYVVSANSTTIKLSTTRGGSPIDITASSTSETGHNITKQTEYVSVTSANTIPLDISTISGTFTLGEKIKNKTRKTFNASTGVDANGRIAIASNPFANNDQVTYRVDTSNTSLAELANNTTYYVVDANSTHLYLSTSSGGSKITLTAGSSETGHELIRTTLSNNGIVVYKDLSLIEIQGNTYPFQSFNYNANYFEITGETIEGDSSGATALIKTVHPAKVYAGNAQVLQVNTTSDFILVGDINGIGNQYLAVTSVQVPNTIPATNSPAGGNSYSNGIQISFSSGNATAFAYTNANGKITTIQMRDNGSNYTSTPSAVIANNDIVSRVVVYNGGSLYANGETVAFNGGNADGTGAIVTDSNGTITSVTITTPGTNYDKKSFNASSAVAANGRIAVTSNQFVNNDIVAYLIAPGNTVITELIHGREYYVVDANSTHLYLSTTSGGSKITLTAGSSETGHYLTRVSGIPTTITTSAGINANLRAYAATGAYLSPTVSSLGSGFMINTTITGSATTTTANITSVVERTNWGFPEISINDFDNLQQVIDEALNIDELEVGTIQFLSEINTGSGYSSNPTVTVVEPLVAALGRPDLVKGGTKGNNAIITAQATNANGIVTAVEIIKSGYGYIPEEQVTLANTVINPISITGAAVVDEYGKGTGFWTDTRGQLSSDKYLTDSYYYQEYSYEIRSTKLFDKYKDIVKQLVHPAGIALFGKFALLSEVSDNESSSSVQSSLTQV